jgi:hypothetical protein
VFFFSEEKNLLLRNIQGETNAVTVVSLVEMTGFKREPNQNGVINVQKNELPRGVYQN